MTLRQLELFVAVAETGSFSRGGELMSLSQSTVSQHIAALEEEFSTRLFDRVGKGAVLTAGGEVFLAQACRILAESTQLRQKMRQFVGLEEAHLALGASNIPANYVVPELLPLLHLRYPGIALDMMMGDSKQILEAVRAQKVELGFVGDRTGDTAFRFVPVLTDRLILIVGVDHPLRSKATIRLDELFEQQLVIREAGSGSYQTLRKALEDVGYDPQALKVLARLGSNEAVRRSVAAGFGCAFVSDLSARDGLQRKELHQVDVAGLDIRRQLWLVHLQERTCSPAAQALMQLMVEYYR